MQSVWIQDLKSVLGLIHQRGQNSFLYFHTVLLFVAQSAMLTLFAIARLTHIQFVNSPSIQSYCIATQFPHFAFLQFCIIKECQILHFPLLQRPAYLYCFQSNSQNHQENSNALCTCSLTDSIFKLLPSFYHAYEYADSQFTINKQHFPK